jgi:hypothetical protein
MWGNLLSKRYPITIATYLPDEGRRKPLRRYAVAVRILDQAYWIVSSCQPLPFADLHESNGECPQADQSHIEEIVTIVAR